MPMTGEGFKLKPTMSDMTDYNLQREMFEWQKRCWEAERQDKLYQAERAERLEREKAERADRLERERLSMERDVALRRVQMEDDARERNRTKATQMKLFGDAMRNTAVRMGTDPLDILPFFENVERLFTNLEVPDCLRVDLMRPYLNERANRLLIQLDSTSLSNYNYVKEYLIKQFRLSSRSFLDRFNSLTRQTDETAKLFVSRLKILLEYYVNSRKATRYDRLMSLLICDRYKSTLSDDCLKYVLSIEATKPDGWLDCDELTDAVDTYYANHVKGRPVASSVGQKFSRSNNVNHNNNRVFEGTRHVNVAQYGSQSTSNNVRPTGGMSRSENNNKPGIRCWKCQGAHKMSLCPMLKHDNRSTRQPGRPGGGRVFQANGVDVTAAAVDFESGSPVLSVREDVDRVAPATRPGTIQCDRCEVSLVDNLEVLHDGDVGKPVSLMQSGDGCVHEARGATDAVELACGGEEGNLPGPAELANDCRQQCSVQTVVCVNDIKELSYCDIIVNEVNCRVKALNDSGCQMTIINRRILTGYDYPVYGKVSIRGFVGDPVECELSCLHLSLPECNTECVVKTICAVSLHTHEDLIVPSSVLTKLFDLYNAQLVGAINSSAVFDSSVAATLLPDNNDDNNVQDNQTPSSSSSTDDGDDDCLNVDDCDTSVVSTDGELSVQELQTEQHRDDTLTGCFFLAKKNKGRYFVKDHILYRFERICGQDVECIVVPHGRRKHVMDLAHSVTGGHFNFRKTCDRIKMSGLTWETVLRDCKEWVKCCRICQQTSRTTCFDRIPIQAIPRATSLFSHFFCDVFGPVFPDRNPRYNYCIVLVDSYSLWVSAYPLRRITASNICTALLNMFSITGLSNEVTIMSTDNATYYKAELTRELLKRIGVSPRFHTPHASWSTGLVERHLQTVKRVLAKLAADHPSTWWEELPFTLWAMRESVSNPLQVQPFMMVTGGRAMRGPLSILRDSWLGFRNLPVSLGKRTEEYLCEIKSKLQVAENYAKEQTELAQRQYVHHYNLRTRPKKFVVGQECLILQPDCTSSRMFARWKGPAIILEIKFPDSYIVEYNGRKYHLHANHLRPFHVYADSVNCTLSDLHYLFLNDINFADSGDDVADDTLQVSVTSDDQCITDYTCSIVYDKDTDFGDLHLVEPTGSEDPAASNISCPLPSTSIDRASLSHLSSDQRTELLSLLDEYSTCFSNTPGLSGAVIHEIPTTSDFVPKRIKGYRIPETLKPEVDRQIAELLRLGFIRESTSSMSSPIVTVIKPSGGVRVCVNYQYLNKYTVPDQITLPDISTIIHRVGNARYISKFDAPSGYHQCEIAEKDRWKTAFVCGSNLYEWVRCPFGLRSSGCTFIRALDKALQPCRDVAENYVDDISVYSSAWDRHIADLRRFFESIKRSGFTLSLKKCEFAKPEVAFLGHIIGSGNRRANPSRIEAIQSLRVPETKKQLRQVLGLFCHFQEYIPKFAHIACPLTDLTNKRVPDRIPWGEREQQAFSDLKAALIKATQEPIGVIDCSKPFTLRVDASLYAVGGILEQEGPLGPRPVAFTSAKFTPTARRSWAVIEKECYAIIWALKKFRCFIYGVSTTVITDHNPLTFLSDTAPKNSKLMRWLLAIQEFNDLHFEYRRGVDNSAADCVSRMVYRDEWQGNE